LNHSRQHLFEIYKTALESVQGESCTRETLRQHALHGSVAVIAIGKASASMMKGAFSVLGEQLAAGLIVTKPGHCEGDVAGGSAVKRFQCIEAGHPVPNENSLSAGKELLSFIDHQPPSRTLVFLISGGTSSLVEVLPKGVSLTDLQKVNEWLLGSGLDITAMNNVRGTISGIKSGRLAKFMEGRKVLNLMISDVPGDIPHVIGSGLLLPNPDLQKSLSKLLQSESSNLEIPKWLDQFLNQSSNEINQAPLVSDSCFNNIDTHIIATNTDAKQAAATVAQALGYDVILHEEMITGDASATGKALAKQLCESRPGLHIWGGETTVRLPENPGVGGRNQHLALAAATVLDGHKNCWLLAAGTDGSDGPTAEAGALVDGETLARGRSVGFDVGKSLNEANSGAFLAATDDLIRTGPTGTNVMDLFIGLKV
jgi:hydroxypyruvate reductase